MSTTATPADSLSPRILVVDNYDSFVFTIVGYLQHLELVETPRTPETSVVTDPVTVLVTAHTCPDMPQGHKR